MNFNISLIFCMLVIAPLSAPCTTPNNEQAKCISLYYCPILISALATQHNTSIEFVRRSSCGCTGDTPMVCCGSFSNFTALPITEMSLKSNRNSNVLPTRTICGLQHADDYYRINNKTAGINEFPWLAFLSYRNDFGKTKASRCSGSLINTRYVVTSATCVRTLNNTLDRVRLGDYHVRNYTDCTEDSRFYECSNAFEDLGIEKVTVHPDFIMDVFDNNIALIRLNRSVSYSDYIRPICLPLPGVTHAKVGDILITSGWGKVSSRGGQTDVKKKIWNKLISNDECSVVYNSSTKQLREFLVKNQVMCTIEPDDNIEFACFGDGGGPVMFLHRYQWQLEGISSFGANSCGSTFPEIHLRVKHYVDWILENLEP